MNLFTIYNALRFFAYAVFIIIKRLNYISLLLLNCRLTRLALNTLCEFKKRICEVGVFITPYLHYNRANF